MNLTRKFIALSVVSAFSFAALTDSEPENVTIPENFSGDVDIKCHQQIKPDDLKYAFSGQAQFKDGAMEAFRVTQISPYIASTNKDLDSTLTRMVDGAERITNRSHGFEISTMPYYSPADTMYIVKDMSTALYSPAQSKTSLFLYCTKTI